MNPVDMKTLLDSNREAWNEAITYHQKARKDRLTEGFADPGFTTFDRDCDAVLLEKLSQFDFAGKTIAQLPCNNGIDLLSLMKFGAKEGVGFDLSDGAIDEARALAKISKRNAHFERVNILEMDAKYNGFFDFVYVSEGSLQWFPDLRDYFAVVARLLKPGGKLLVFEMHPFAYFFEQGFDPAKNNWEQFPSYFEKGPYSYPEGLDYIGGTSYEAKPCYWFLHQLSDILTALLQNGLPLREFQEFNMEMANNAALQQAHKFPLSYLMVCEKA